MPVRVIIFLCVLLQTILPTLGEAAENPLKTFEHLARKLLKDDSFALGNEWRDANRNLLEISSDAAITNPVTQCGGTTYQIAATATYPAMSYQITVTSSPIGICLWLQTELSAININYNPSTSSALQTSFDLGNGIACPNCWAYVGANLQFSMSCSTTSCNVGFATGGGIGFNFNLTLDNPTFTATSPVYSIVAPPAGAPNSIATTDYKTLYSVDGITINAVSALQVQVTGTGSATGTANMDAGFSTSALLEFGLTGTTFVEGFSAGVTVNSPSLTSSLQLAGVSATVVITPTVYWQIGIIYNSGTSLVPINNGAAANFVTPLPATYTYTQGTVSAASFLGTALTPPSAPFQLRGPDIEVRQAGGLPLPVLVEPAREAKSEAEMAAAAASEVRIAHGYRRSLQANSSCTNTETLAVQAALTGFTVEIIDISYPISAPVPIAAVAVSSTSGTQCLGVIATEGSSSSSSSSSSGLSSGEIAAAVIIPILFVCGCAGVAFYFYNRKSADSDASNYKTGLVPPGSVQR